MHHRQPQHWARTSTPSSRSWDVPGLLVRGSRLKAEPLAFFPAGTAASMGAGGSRKASTLRLTTSSTVGPPLAA